MGPVAGWNGRAGCPVEESKAGDQPAGPDAQEQEERQGTEHASYGESEWIVNPVQKNWLFGGEKGVRGVAVDAGFPLQ